MDSRKKGDKCLWASTFGITRHTNYSRTGKSPVPNKAVCLESMHTRVLSLAPFLLFLRNLYMTTVSFLLFQRLAASLQKTALEHPDPNTNPPLPLPYNTFPGGSSTPIPSISVLSVQTCAETNKQVSTFPVPFPSKMYQPYFKYNSPCQDKANSQYFYFYITHIHSQHGLFLLTASLNYHESALHHYNSIEVGS